jgi:hypothetical protein
LKSDGRDRRHCADGGDPAAGDAAGSKSGKKVQEKVVHGVGSGSARN